LGSARAASAADPDLPGRTGISRVANRDVQSQ